MYSWVYIGVPLSCETTMGEYDRGCMGMGSGFRDFTPIMEHRRENGTQQLGQDMTFHSAPSKLLQVPLWDKHRGPAKLCHCTSQAQTKTDVPGPTTLHRNIMILIFVASRKGPAVGNRGFAILPCCQVVQPCSLAKLLLSMLHQLVSRRLQIKLKRVHAPWHS